MSDVTIRTISPDQHDAVMRQGSTGGLEYGDGVLHVVQCLEIVMSSCGPVRPQSAASPTCKRMRRRERVRHRVQCEAILSKGIVRISRATAAPRCGVKKFIGFEVEEAYLLKAKRRFGSTQ